MFSSLEDDVIKTFLGKNRKFRGSGKFFNFFKEK